MYIYILKNIDLNQTKKNHNIIRFVKKKKTTNFIVICKVFSFEF